MSDSVPGGAEVELSVAAPESTAGTANRSGFESAKPGGTLPSGARQRILDVARERFSSGGYERTPLRAIADALGVTKAALYHHFRAKEDILVAIVTPMLDRIDEVIGCVGEGLESASRRREFLRGYVDALTSQTDIAALLLRDPGVREHPVGQRFSSQHGRMRALLGAGDDLATGIRVATALRALELAVVEFGEPDPTQLRETALNIAMAVLDLYQEPPRPE